MDLGDWLLALHLLSAAAVVGGTVLFGALAVTLRRADRPAPVRDLLRLARIGGPLMGASAGLVLVFGVWLAFERPGYHVWDGWILAAIVLWLVAAGAGERSGRILERADGVARAALERGDDGPDAELAATLRDPQALVLHLVSAAAILLILLDMVYKPGA